METAETQPDSARRPLTFLLGGDLPIHRVGFGALRITGQPGNWGYPPDPDAAVELLRLIPELGITFIDTADSYGPEVSETLIHRALHPYPEGLVIGTKVGAVKLGPGMMRRNGDPAYLKQAAEYSLRRLQVDCIDLLQYHWIDPDVPLEESIGAFAELRAEGKIRHIGLCNIGAEELERARRVAPIVSVQNPYSIADQGSDQLVDVTRKEGIAFLPYTPLVGGALAQGGGPLDEIGQQRGATAAQIALAWLLARADNVVVIPGTSSPEHLRENAGAADVVLGERDLTAIETILTGGSA